MEVLNVDRVKDNERRHGADKGSFSYLSLTLAFTYSVQSGLNVQWQMGTGGRSRQRSNSRKVREMVNDVTDYKLTTLHAGQRVTQHRSLMDTRRLAYVQDIDCETE